VASAAGEFLRSKSVGPCVIEFAKGVRVDSLSSDLLSLSGRPWLTRGAFDAVLVPVRPVAWPEVTAAARLAALLACATRLAGGEPVAQRQSLEVRLPLSCLSFAVRGAASSGALGRFRLPAAARAAGKSTVWEEPRLESMRVADTKVALVRLGALRKHRF
jgi:hypothetical protein